MTKPANNEQTSSTQFITYLLMFVAIVAVGVASRFWLVDFPNFKPVAALILFAGFFFRKSWVAIAALVVVMMVSDIQLGVYQWQLALTVYASLAISCGLGLWVKRSVEKQNQNSLLIPVGAKQVGRFALASLLMSTAFFLLTNGAVCAAGWYPQTGEGLLASYSAGLPFFRATLVGDLFFTTSIVSVYCLARQFACSLSAKRAVAVSAG